MTVPPIISRKRFLVGIVVLNLAGGGLLWTLRDHIIPHDLRRTKGVVERISEVDVDGTKCLDVEYSYQVGGAHFSGDRLAAAPGCLSTAEATRERFAPGNPIAVWYDPDDASFAVMDPRYKWDAAVIWCTLLIFIALGNAELIRQARLAPEPDTET